MDSEQQALWSRIESLEIDDPASALPFSVRLARENGWSAIVGVVVVEDVAAAVVIK